MSSAARRTPMLKKLGVRMSWSRWNLYAFSQLRDVKTHNFTLYQQKWKSKSMTRYYHGELIGEKKWQRMVRKRADAVVSMSPAYLAEHDGSDESAGRGAGKDVPYYLDNQVANSKGLLRREHVPYMQMLYAQLERRLDIAVFRALFASSIRQARQFCLRGAVKVNGQELRYPGYLLNPGDMFQIDKNLVMWATGAKKNKTLSRIGRQLRVTTTKTNIQLTERRERVRQARVARQEARSAAREAANPASTDAISNIEATGEVGEQENEVIDEPELETDRVKRQQRACQKILNRIRVFMASSSRAGLGARAKQGLREITYSARNLGLRVHRREADEVDQQLREWEEKMAQLMPEEARRQERQEERRAKRDERLEAMAIEKRDRIIKEDAAKEKRKRAAENKSIKAPGMNEDLRNPVDATRPYNTPWEPKPYMSPFAFIPRYLEVNQLVCAAVYLRHPVARKGLAEVPSPFSPGVMQLAHSWYLRRR